MNHIQKFMARATNCRSVARKLLLIAAPLLLPVALMGQGGDFPVPVEVATVEAGAYVQPVSLTGTVEPLRMTQLASEVDGRVEQLLVDEGDTVEQGTVILKLREVPLQLALEQARAGVLASQAELDELRAGSRVEDIALDEAELAEARAEMEDRRRDLARYERLFREGSGSEQEYDRARSAFEVSQARVAAREAELSRSRAGERAERLAAAEAALQVQVAMAAIAQETLERATITAPFDGRVTRKLTEVGSWVGEGDAVIELVQIDTVRVRINGPQEHIGRITLGGELDKLAFDAIPGTSFSGKVSQIIPVADVVSRAFPVRVDLPNENGQVLPGMIARVVLAPTSEAERSMVIPRDAIVAQGEAIVYRVHDGDGGPEAVRVPVTTGRNFGTSIEVFGELKPGDRVVVRGNERLQPGAQLDIKNSGNAPPSSSRSGQANAG